MLTNKIFRLSAILLFIPALLLTSSCGTPPQEQGPEPEPRVAAPKDAADFTLTSLNGESIGLSQFRGKKSVLLVFGATWCPYCVQEVPELKEIYNAYNDGEIKVLYVDVQESRETVASFVEKHSIPYTVLLDADSSVARDYGVRGIPHQVMIAKDGSILYEGPRPYQGLVTLVEELLEREKGGAL